MTKIFKFFLIAATTLGFVSCSDNKDPLEIFFDADFAANKNKTAEFTMEFKNKSGEGQQQFTSKVFVAKIDEKSEVLKYRLEESSGNTITYDGNKFIVKDDVNKSISVSAKPEMATQLAMELSQSFYMIIDNKIDTAVIRKSTKNLSIVGDAEVNGEDCYELSQKADGHAEYKVENHYFFSKEDKLMKKYVSKIYDKSNKLMQSVEFTISKITLNKEIPSDVFTQPVDTVNYKFTDLDKSHDMQSAMNEQAPVEEQPTTGLLPVGNAAPDWTLLDAKGNKVSLNQLKGKVVVLDFWATWCNPCKKVMPIVQKLHDKYKSQNVMVFGVNTWEQADAPKFMKDNKYTYGLLLKGDEVAKKYMVEGIPTLYVIDKSGKIVFAESGATDKFEQNLEMAIKKSL